MELEQDLRAASDRVMRTIERLQELEIEKRAMEPGTPGFRKVAREVERLAATVFAHTHVQQKLAEASVALREQSGVAPPPINEIEPAREIQTILAEWRDAERRVAEAATGSPERARAQEEADRLRAEYGRTYNAISTPTGRLSEGS